MQPPRLNDPRYVESVICDQRFPGCQPKARLAAITPSADSALISIRLRPGLGDAEREKAISLIRQAVADPQLPAQAGRPGIRADAPELRRQRRPGGLRGACPGALDPDLRPARRGARRHGDRALRSSSARRSGCCRWRSRSAPRGSRSGSCRWGGSLTMASIAVLPVLIGLSVDYAIQFQARFAEAVAGSSPPRAAVEAAARGGPIIATAGLATAAGFGVLVFSPIPMVRAFALLLVLGIAIAFALALTVGLSVLSLLPPEELEGSRGESGRSRLGGVAPALKPGGRGPCDGLTDAVGSSARSAGKRGLSLSLSAPGRVLLIGALLAIAGWGIGTRIPVISDIASSCRSFPALQNVDQLEQATGISGLTYVTVTAPDLTDPAVITWITIRAAVMERHGYSGSYPSCQASSDPSSAPSNLASRLPLRQRAGGSQPAADQDRPAPAPHLRRAGHGEYGPGDGQDGEHRRDHVRDQGHAVRPAKAADRRHSRAGQPAGHRQRPAARGPCPGPRVAHARGRRVTRRSPAAAIS